jgi:hypothetical protein
MRDINDRCRLLEVGQRLGRCGGFSVGGEGAELIFASGAVDNQSLNMHKKLD